MEYTSLLNSCKIGSMEVRNRFVVPAMGTGLGDHHGKISQRSIDYYAERARGGFGLIIVEVSGVNQQGKCTPDQPGLWNDDYQAEWARLTGAVHGYGAKIAVQLHHAGRQSSPELNGVMPSAPSAVPCPVFDLIPHALRVAEIWELIHQFGDAARRARDAGFDAVEIHGAHGYLVNQFLSPHSNKRIDEFGGNLEGRTKFAREIIQDIKRKAGLDFPVIIRISGDEKINGGIDVPEAKQIAMYLEQAGADAIHVSLCTYGSLNWMSVPAAVPASFNTYAAGEIRESVGIPVIGVGRLNTPEICRDVIDTGKADFISLGRASIADPHFPRKVAQGRVDEISPCIACLQACIGAVMDPSRGAVSCLVNPRSGNEGKYPEEKAATSKNVVVIGGGPAGLLAALTAAQRGHKVSLYEKDEQLGGQFRIAGIPPTKHLILHAVKYYIEMGKKHGVQFHTGTEATPELLRACKPDAVILATGSKPLLPAIDGIDSCGAVLAGDVLDGKVAVGHKVLVAGGGMVGAETADYLGEHTRAVTVVEMLPAIAGDVLMGVREHLLKRLDQHGVEQLTGATIQRLTKDGAVIEHNGAERTLSGYDNVVLALGTTEYNPLEEAVRGLVGEVYVIGDAHSAGKADRATAAALEAAYQL